VVRYGVRIIILKVKELRLDLAYHFKIGILEYSGEPAEKLDTGGIPRFTILLSGVPKFVLTRIATHSLEWHS